VSKEN